MIAAVLAVVITLILMHGEQLGIPKASSNPGYVTRLFDDSKVHTMDIQIENFGQFIEHAPAEEYVTCTVEIDGEEFYQAGVRAKGNNSMRLTKEYGLSRYSLKLEFDQFLDGGNYHGLDKLSLDASFQDNSYMKTYIAYDMMSFMEVPTPLCSYVWLTINGESWGLYLAVEEPEEAFARRNFGNEYGNLYKPDYRSLNDENADLALKYIDDNPASYPGIFDNARFDITEADKQRLIGALKTLSTGEHLTSAVNVDEVLRYFTVQVFVMNWDSYIGRTGHNYFLHEQDGVLSILPWDYNLAFGTYALGMTDPIRDPAVLINYPVNTPADGSIMLNRPLYHNLLKNREYLALYHNYFDLLLSEYFENGQFEAALRQTEAMISPYVQQDPTSFCSYEDHRLAVNTLYEVCRLRAESIRSQLSGKIPITIRGQQEFPDQKLDASHIDLSSLGDFDDLEHARSRQDAALDRVISGGVSVKSNFAYSVSARNIGVDRYRSPVSGRRTTICFPAFSGRFASSAAAQRAAPEEIPTRMPSLSAIWRPVS